MKMCKMVNRTIMEGKILQLPCEVKTGFFPDEFSYHIVVKDEVDDRIIMGHVSSSSIVQKNGNMFVPALVMKSLERESARIFLPGELVSDTNPVTVPAAWLSKFF